MKKAILFLFISFLTTSLHSENLPKKSKIKAIKIKIIPQGRHEGHRVYKVTTPEGKIMEYMYMEEIKECMSTGIWKYNEKLALK